MTSAAKGRHVREYPDASENEIFKFGRTSVLPRDEVVDLESGWMKSR
jgi:hypothetical protein